MLSVLSYCLQEAVNIRKCFHEKGILEKTQLYVEKKRNSPMSCEKKRPKVLLGSVSMDYLTDKGVWNVFYISCSFLAGSDESK